MTFDHFNKRTHLYLALFLLPWFLMYGLSSLLINHKELLKDPNEGAWTQQADRSYDRPVPDDADLREIAYQVLNDVDMKGSFWVNLDENRNRLNINRFDSWSATRLVYHIDEQRLTSEHKKFASREFITRMHTKGGFHQESFFSDLWAIVIDLVCAGFLIWIATGIFMWWKIKSSRTWGFITVGGGLFSYMIFLLTS